MSADVALGKVDEKCFEQDCHGVFLPFGARILGCSMTVETAFIAYGNAADIMSSGMCSRLSDVCSLCRRSSGYNNGNQYRLIHVADATFLTPFLLMYHFLLLQNNE